MPVSSVSCKPGNPNACRLATFGAGVWSYDFASSVKPPTPPVDPDEEPARVGDPYASYDFEDGDQGWSSAPSDDAAGVPVPWTYGSPGEGQDGSSDDSGFAWSVAGPSGYVDSQDSELLSPAVTTEAGPTVIQFGMHLDTEAGFETR